MLRLKEKASALRGGRKYGAQKDMKSEVELRSLGHGSYDFCKSPDEVLIAQRYDNKLVTVGSTYNSCEPVRSVRRWSKLKKSTSSWLNQIQSTCITSSWETSAEQIR